ncbi:MAG: sulfatase [Pirellulales bacterium]
MRFCVALTCLFVLPQCLSPATAADNKNVVLIVVDDQGFEMGCYGNDTIRTPNLDALAASGTRFTQAYATVASCSASRSVILSGLFNHNNGQYGHAHDYHHFAAMPRVRGLSLLLADAGYRTCSIGKFHVAPQETFDFEVYANDGIQGARNPVRMAENARRFIEDVGDDPFFLYFCTSDPHRARVGFSNDQPHPGVDEVHYEPADVVVPPYLPDTDAVRGELAEFYQAISRVDQGVGRLMQVLDDTGHTDDTLVIYISDNGPPFPGAKTTIYDPGIHLPMLVRRPGQSPGVVNNAMISFVDLTPTILEFTGAAAPDYPLHGRSFLSIIDQSDPPGWDEVRASHTFHEITMYYPMRAIRTRQYKYILNLASAWNTRSPRTSGTRRPGRKLSPTTRRCTPAAASTPTSTDRGTSCTTYRPTPTSWSIWPTTPPTPPCWPTCKPASRNGRHKRKTPG